MILLTGFMLNRNLDNRIQHEMENILKTITIRNDSLILLSTKELDESDFKEIKENSYFLQIVDPQGNILIKSENLGGMGTIPFNYSRSQHSFTFHNLIKGNDELRAGYYRFTSSNGKIAAHMQLSVYRAGVSSVIRDIIIFNLLSLPILLLIVIAASIVLVKKTLLPVNKIIQTAEKISTQNLNERINYKAEPSDEIGRLRDTLNNLFERLEVQVNQISQFTDHASHQLMNPLTIVKSEIDYALKKDRDISEYKNSLIQLREQTEKMIKIISHLLMASKQNEDQKLTKSLFNLSKLIAKETDETYQHNSISSDIEPEIYLRGNSESFSIVLNNLLDNAIKYSNRISQLKVILKRTNGIIELRVIDNGIGISLDEKEKIFEKFFRTDKADQLGIKGFGLGLSVAKSIITQMGGTISVEDNIPQGSIFIIRLPEIRVE
jgi:signal transduction histidine kinase